MTRSRSKNMSNTQESSLDLCNDQMDYKTSTKDKHPQRYATLSSMMNLISLFIRRKYVAGTNSISKRPFATYETFFLIVDCLFISEHFSHGRTSSTMTLPSLPDDSQTTDDLLNKI